MSQSLVSSCGSIRDLILGIYVLERKLWFALHLIAVELGESLLKFVWEKERAFLILEQLKLETNKYKENRRFHTLFLNVM